MNKNIDCKKYRIQISKQAKEFVEAEEMNKLSYIGGEIISSAVVFNAWDESIHKVCLWMLEHGRGLQPDLAQHLIDKNI